MVTKHSLVKYEYQSGNKVGSQHYIECSCGFQGRLGTKEAAQSQFDNHLQAHGNESYFSSLATKVEDKKPETSTTQVKSGLTPIGSAGQPAGAWKPLGAK